MTFPNAAADEAREAFEACVERFRASVKDAAAIHFEAGQGTRVVTAMRALGMTSLADECELALRLGGSTS